MAQGDESALAALDAHDIYFSFGENLGAPDCTVPVERYEWFPTRQPVVMDLWRTRFRQLYGAVHHHRHLAQQGQRSSSTGGEVSLDQGS